MKNLGGSLPDVWYCLSHAPQWIPFKWVRFWKATENAVMARPLRCLGWAPTWREEMPSKHRTVDENICFWKPPHHQGSLCNIQVVWNGDEWINWLVSPCILACTLIPNLKKTALCSRLMSKARTAMAPPDACPLASTCTWVETVLQKTLLQGSVGIYLFTPIEGDDCTDSS